MLGAIIGDIVGSRFEFDNTFDYDFVLFTKDCDFTDDTICTIAVADAILKGEDYKNSVLRWCRKYPYPKGAYGSSFIQWIHSENPHPYGSFGNGAAMRVSPVGWAFKEECAVIREAMNTAKISHSHTEGLIGASATALGILYLRKEPSSDWVAEDIMIRHYGKDWESDLIPQGHFDETCQGCVPLSFHLVKEAHSFEDAIRKAVSYGGDSDTVGAIVGSLAEARFGLDEGMAKKALEYLPEDMREVVRLFKERHYLCAKA